MQMGEGPLFLAIDVDDGEADTMAALPDLLGQHPPCAQRDPFEQTLDQCRLSYTGSPCDRDTHLDSPLALFYPLSIVTEKERLFKILRHEIALHPQMTAADLQKLVYQAVFGVGHLLNDRTGFTERLAREWEGIDPAAGVGMEALQTIDPAGRVGRLHLQACKARGVKIDELTRFLVAQSPAGGSRERFVRLWSLICELADEEKIRLTGRSLASLPFPETISHHSAGYGEASYRVVNNIASQQTAVFIQGFPGGL